MGISVVLTGVLCSEMPNFVPCQHPAHFFVKIVFTNIYGSKISQISSVISFVYSSLPSDR